MRYLKFVLITLISFLIVAAPIAAQTDDELLKNQNLQSDLGQTFTDGNNVLTVKLLRDLQDPESKNIYYRFLITSTRNSDRVELEWSIQGVSQSPDARKKNLVLKAGVTLTESFLVLPRDFGRTEFRVEVRVFDGGQNYAAASRDQFITNKELDIIPITSEYQNAKNLNMAKKIGLGILAIVIVYVVGSFVYKKFKQRLAAEQTGKSLF